MARFLVLLLFAAVCAALAVAGLSAAEALWYSAVDPPRPQGMASLSGRVQSVSECSRLKGGSSFVVVIGSAEESTSLSKRCGRELRDRLARTVGTEAVAFYRIERSLLLFRSPVLYGFSGKEGTYLPVPTGNSAWHSVGVSVLLAALVLSGVGLWSVGKRLLRQRQTK